MMTKLVFDPNARVGRTPYLLSAIGLLLIFTLALWPGLAGPLSAAPEPFSFTALGRIADHPFTSLLALADANPIAGASAFAVAAIVAFSFVVLSLRRLRDADRSVYWVCLALVSPALLMIALMVFPTAPVASRLAHA